MKPVSFDEMNTVIGENQAEYMPLPALVKPCSVRDGDDVNVIPRGNVISCWELSDEEIAEIVKTKRVYLSVLTFGEPVRPCLVTVKKEDVV